MYRIDTKTLIHEHDILERVNQFEVWWWILGKTVREYQLFCNPLRRDTTPGCWLAWGILKIDKVVLNDFADRRYHGIDIFQAVCLKHSVSREKACEIINKKFNLGLPHNPSPILSDHQIKIRTTKVVGKFKSHISFKKRHWSRKDAEYWTKYGISSAQLNSDGVFPVRYYRKNNRYDKTIKLYVPEDICYAYTFPSNNVKLYQPNASKSKKWKCNTDNNDIWGYNIFPTSNVCIVTKSYKDYRVLRNTMSIDIYAIQNENILLPEDFISYLARFYDKAYILFDNDEAGIKGAEDNVSYINSFHSKLSTAIKIDGRKRVKDSAEFYEKYGEEELFNYINSLL